MLLVHAFHAAAVAAWHCRCFLLFRQLGDQGFGGQHQGRNRSGILQRGAHDLGRIEHARLDQIFVLTGQSVVAEVIVLGVVDAAQNDCAFFAGVLGDLA